MEPSSAHEQPKAGQNPSKEFWNGRRKRMRDNKKLNKQTSKAPKLAEGTSPAQTRAVTSHQKRRLWKDVSLEEIPFATPTLVVDLSFESAMVEKRLRSLSSQIMYLYAANRSHIRPCKLVLASWIEGSLTDQLLANHTGWSEWKIFKESRPVEKIYPIDQLIYLSPDSENLLESLDQSKIYIIGGIVDDNQLKGLSLKKATSLGIRHAKLPIKQYLPSFKNQSLNINHVAKVIIDWADSGDLTSALEANVPQRYAQDDQPNLEADSCATISSVTSTPECDKKKKNSADHHG